MSVAEVITRHEASGRRFEAAGVASFTLDEGSGAPVVCMHGVPSSSFLYRKVVPELAARGARGIAFDLPGLGLADRPADFDYSWTGLGAWSVAAIDALDLDRFHLVVHDIGGPVGFELATAMPERILSLTILNTVIDAGSFHKPWVMRPFEIPGLNRAYLASMSAPMFRMLMALQGIERIKEIPRDETGAYVDLLKRTDGGKAFLKIMQSFETTPAKTALYTSAIKDVPYPVQVVWGENDPALKVGTFGRVAQELAGVDTIHRLPGKHFLQEDNAPEIAEFVVRIT